MFANTETFSGFAVDDLDKAREFYGEKLGIETRTDQEGTLTLNLSGNRPTLIYPKPDFTPATYTILNFLVDDVEKAVDDLGERGVSFLRYDGFEQDERGHLARRGRSVHRLVHGPCGQHPGGAGRELVILAPAEVPRDVREERLVGGDLDEEPAPGRGQRDHGRVLGAVAVVADRARRRGARRE